MNPKNIFEGNKVVLPREIIYESSIEEPVGIALAEIEESEPHFHEKTTEWYLVTKGVGVVSLDGKEFQLKEYDFLEIPPNAVHSVKSEDKIIVWVISYPPWRKKDHYKV